MPQGRQEARACLLTSSVLVVACPLPGFEAATWSAVAAGVPASGLRRLRAYAAAAPATAVTVARLADIRHRQRRGLLGSSRRAAEDSTSETFGATLSWRTWPVRSTRGAAQARVLCTRRPAAATVLLASGLTWAAAGFM